MGGVSFLRKYGEEMRAMSGAAFLRVDIIVQFSTRKIIVYVELSKLCCSVPASFPHLKREVHGTVLLRNMYYRMSVELSNILGKLT